MVVPIYYASHVPLVRTLATTSEAIGVEFLAFCNSKQAQVRAEQAGLKTASCSENIGYGQAANFIAQSRGFDWLILCNDDLEVARTDFAGFIGIISSLRPTDPWAIGLIERGYRRLHHTPGVLGVLSNVSLVRALRDRIGRTPQQPKRNDLEVNETLTEVGSGIAFPFVCVGINSASWHAVGGFDPAFPLYFEDTDFVARASRIKQHRFGVVRARMHHYHSSSTRQDLRAIVPVFAWSAYVYICRHTTLGSRGAKVAICAALFVRLLLAVAVRSSLMEHMRGTAEAFQTIVSGRKPSLPPGAA